MARLTWGEVEKIQELRRDGKSIRAISDVTGHAVATVHKYADSEYDSDETVTCPECGHEFHAGEEQLKEQLSSGAVLVAHIQALHSRGQSVRTIAAKTGVPRSTVHRILGGTR
ncbi:MULTISPECIES: helix-turn-helix domain-containing protein [Rhodococcus]|uniref:HTH iclR-type domain-containing protein n=1 Tax=Rhodococcus opacus RKJ300 = JCM 13270 TaxID=1165867 RepID=I0WV00_RHOOP|nr:MULTISPECIES: helix-turn-helix domain-containing protein [Rhodococcus]EID80216.1 hypothetical protein W59_08379 [Rhodococcus opacus RKJ300 = JCM 13270]QQZ17712.1 helix-turn-helix domain-containing protein [Rhodococcus sp. 21391]